MIDPAVLSDLQAAAGYDFVVELVQTFGEEAPALLTELRHAQRSGATDRFRRAAHSLKSNSNTFGATRLAELARTLELGGMPAGTVELDALDAKYAGTIAALKTLASEAPRV